MRNLGIMSVPLLSMPQLAEALEKEDDWTGLADAASRRKRQNRLNVRAHRRRKALEIKKHQAMVSASSNSLVTRGQSLIPYWIEDQQSVCNLPVSLVKTLGVMDCPLLPLGVHSPTPHGQVPKRVIFPLCPDHLITLLQYNVLRAFMINRALLTPLNTVTDCSSNAVHVLPPPSLPREIPPSLQPTHLQLTVPHENWIDIIPHPQWRDNLIMAAGQFDEDELWSDTIGGLFEGFPQSEIERRGIIVWSPPWDVSGWEITEGFWRKWAWSMKGCEDITEVTNRWRSLRGEEPLIS